MEQFFSIHFLRNKNEKEEEEVCRHLIKSYFASESKATKLKDKKIFIQKKF